MPHPSPSSAAHGVSVLMWPSITIATNIRTCLPSVTVQALRVVCKPSLSIGIYSRTSIDVPATTTFESPISGEDIKDIALKREVTIKLNEDVKVTLKNAVCLPNSATERLQLGMDFFA